MKSKKIVIIGPRMDASSIEMTIKLLASNYQQEQIVNAPGLASIIPISPETTDLVLCNQAEFSEEEVAFLQKNHRIPIINISSDENQDENVLIETFNYFASSPLPIGEFAKRLAHKINDGLEFKQNLDQLLASAHSAYLLDANLIPTLKKEVLATKQPVAEDRNQLISRMPPRNISLFEALYQILSREETAAVIKDDQDVNKQLITGVVPNLQLLEKRILEGKGHEHEALESRKAAMDAFGPIIQILSDKSKWRQYRAVRCRMGGSTIAEKGSRFLILGKRKRKYTEEDAKNIFFIRDIYTRKSTPHQVIADMRYRCSNLFTENAGMGRCAAILPPMYHDNMTWMVEKGILGQDLEFVMSELWKRIRKGGRGKSKFMRIKEVLEEKYIKDLVAWQKNTRKIAQEFPDIQRTSAAIAEGYVENLSNLAGHYESHNVFSKSDCELWRRSLGALTERNLGITKKKTVLSLDASSKNVRIRTLKNNPALEEIIDEITTGGKLDEAKIDVAFYHMDTGFVLTHILEDFFHIVDAYEVSDAQAGRSKVISTLNEKYRDFCKSSEIPADPVELYLMGAYRNLRRAHLVINEFESKNINDAIEGIVQKREYEKDRKDFINMHRHHVGRASIYLKELKKHFYTRMQKSAGGFAEFKKEYAVLNLKIKKDGLPPETVQNCIGFFNKLETLIPQQGNHRKERYLCAMMYSSMANAMGKLCERLTDFNTLPRYNELQIGDLNAGNGTANRV